MSEETLARFVELLGRLLARRLTSHRSTRTPKPVDVEKEREASDRAPEDETA